MQRPDSEEVRADDEIEFWRQAVVRRLDALMAPVGHAGDAVCLAMQAGVVQGGKRVRALMLIGVCRGLGLDPLPLLDLACSLEMIHAASLSIDDLPCMDDADERRGQPALHLRFGESTALLASIGMLTHAFKTVAEIEDIPVHLRSRLVVLLADAVGPNGLVRGQYRDLASGAGRADAAALKQVNELKTGMLFRAAMLMPAVIAEAEPSTLEAIAQLATDVGHAFQLGDDLQDGRSTTDGSLADLDGHATLVTALGPQRARAKFERHLRHAHQSIAVLFPESRLLTALVQRIAAMSPAEPVAAGIPAHRTDVQARVAS